MTFLVDNQLPPALVRWMATPPGFDALHVADEMMSSATDPELWRLATERGWVIVSKDRDFTRFVGKRAFYQQQPPLLWVRLRNCRRRELLAAFERQWQEAVRLLQAGQKLVEIR